MQMKNTYLYKILQLFYGELLNKDNSFSKRVMRVISRTPFKNFAYYTFSLFKKKNPHLSTNSNIYFKNNLDQRKIVSELKSQGISEDIFLKEDVIEKILEEIKNSQFQINRSKDKIFLKDKNKYNDIYLLRLFNPHSFIEEINKIALNHNLFSSVTEYLGCQPLIISSQIWWTYPFYNKKDELDNPPGNEFGFHYDVDDFKFLKLFFYLNDVDQDCGPHVYIKNNGKKNIKEYLNRRIDDEYALNFYSERVKTIIGKAGSGFIEDTSFYHKGSNPIKNSGRGVLQIIYGVHKWE